MLDQIPFMGTLLSPVLAANQILAKLFLLTPFQRAKTLATAIKATCAQHLRKGGHMWALQFTFRNLTSVSKRLLLSYPASPTSCPTGQHIVSFPPARRSFVLRKTSIRSANALQHHGDCTARAARLCTPPRAPLWVCISGPLKLLQSKTMPVWTDST